MSDSISFGVDYETSYDLTNLGVAFEALRTAVTENWAERHDELSPPGPPSPVDVDEWLPEAVPERMHDIPAGSQSLFSKSLCFSYSPTSAWVARLKAIRWEDGTMGVTIWISERALIETLSERLERCEEDPDFRPPWPGADDPDYLAWWERFHATHREPWQVNRDCLLHIFDRLRGALPVRKASLDERLLNGLDPRSSEYTKFIRRSPVA